MRIALTIDTELPNGRGDPRNTGTLLDVLAATAVRATFFLTGRWVDAEPVLARRIAEGGHLIGNHTYAHRPLTLLPARAINASILRAGEAIGAATGVDPAPWFRCPFGAGARNARILKVVESAGYTHIGWDVEADDWKHRQTPEGVIAAVLSGCQAHGDGTRVLLHNWPDVTAQAIPSIIRDLRDIGATFVGVDELPAGRIEASDTRAR